MKKTVWKFPLAHAVINRVSMPAGAKPLCVNMQKGEYVLWCEVDPKAEPRDAVIQIVGTGRPILEERGAPRYIGTLITSTGRARRAARQ